MVRGDSRTTCRRATLRTGLAVAALGAALVAAAFAGPGDAAGDPGPSRPNVIVLMTDDQNVESLRVMDRTRRLIGAEGVTFANSFASWPLCCPSRATFLTGQYAHNHRVLGNLPPDGGYGAFDESETLPLWLQRAGYRTVHIGKYLNGYGREVEATIPPGWSEWYGAVDPSTYQMWGYTLNENGVMRTYGSVDDEDPALYQTDVYRAKAVDAVRRLAPSEDPFFLSVAFLAPHFEGKPRGDTLPPRPAPRHRGTFADEPLPRPPAFDEEDMTDKPALLSVAFPRLTADAIAKIEERYRGELESLLAVDEAIEEIVATLEASGELDNTLIVFTSDNGLFHGEHRIPKSKYLPYDAALRVPLMVRGPGIPGGATSSELVANVDWAPTVLDAAGATAAREPDGRSLLPFARDPALRTARPLLFEAPTPAPRFDLDQDGGDDTPDSPVNPTRLGLNGQRDAPGYRAVRTPRWHYIEWTTGDRELYDLERDPDRLESQHANPAYLQTQLALALELNRLWSCSGAECRSEVGPIPGPVAR